MRISGLYQARSCDGHTWLYRALVVVCVTLMFSGACTGHKVSGPVDESFLTDEPCAAPCWQGIVPGVSTQADVVQVLEASIFVKPDSVETTTMKVDCGPSAYTSWNTSREQPRPMAWDPYNRIFLRGGTVLYVRLHPDQHITLGDVVAKLGPPDRVHASLGGYEARGYQVTVDYPALGVTVACFMYPVDPDEVLQGPGAGRLSADMPVTEIIYYAPRPLPELLSDVFCYPPKSVSAFLEDSHSWPGFTAVPLGRRDRYP